MRTRASPFLLLLVCAGIASGQGGDSRETRPGGLAPADKRAVPATAPEARRLIADLEADRAALDALQREDPSSSRGRTIQLLDDEIKAIKRAGDLRQELVAETSRGDRASTGIDELRKKLAQVDKDEEPLPDPTDPQAEVMLARERAAIDGLIHEEQKHRDEAAESAERLKLEQDNLLRKVPAKKRDLAESQVDLKDYETDSREALSAGIPPEQGRVMLEQVFLYRLRVAGNQAEVDLVRYQAGDLSDLLIDHANYELAFATEKLRRHQARRAKIEALVEKATASRLERGRAERARIEKVASEAPDWARAYWELRAKEAAIQVEIADLVRKKHALEARVVRGGEIETLDTDASEEARSFERAESRKSALEDVVPGTTRALTQLIAKRETELDRVQTLQEEIRFLRKEARESQRGARGQDARADADELDLARAGLAPAKDAEAGTPTEREAASPTSWQALKTNLLAAHASRSKLLEEYDQLLAKAGDALLTSRTTREKSLLKYRNALLWTRDPSEISVESLDRARADLGAAPEKLGVAAGDAASSSWDWAASSLRGGRFLHVALVAIALLVACSLVVLLHRRASKTYHSGPPGQGSAFTLGGAAKVGATVLRNAELTALLAFAGIALPAIAGAPRDVVLVCAAVFGPPLVFRLARALIDVLFGTGVEGQGRGLLGLSEAPAALLRRTCVMLLRVCACFVPLAILLDVTGYKARNPGFVELLWLLNSVGCYLVVLGVLLRPSGVATLIRRKGSGAGRTGFLRTLVTAGYPVLIAAVIFLLVLRSLSYRVAVHFFLERFLISAAWIAGAILLRRWFIRILLGGEPKVAMPPSDLAADAPKYEAQGRRALLDRLRRLALTLVVFGPAVFFVFDAWGLTGAGWDAVFNRPLAPLSDTLTLGDVLNATLTAAVAVFLIRSTRDMLRFVILPRTSLDVGVRYTIVTLTTYSLVALAAVVILGGQLKVSPAVIGGFVAALGLGLGFGLQEIINNFFSGIILLVERPLKVGDTVSIGGTTGRVDRINMRSTTIMTAENTGVIVPNKDLISSTVTNWSAGTPTIRETMPLGIAYGSDTALFRKTVLEVVESHGLVLKAPAPDLVFTGFGASSMDFQLRYWLRLGSPGSKVKSDLYFALDSAFRRHGIEMPFPQHDVHVRTMPATGPGVTKLAGFTQDGDATAGKAT